MGLVFWDQERNRFAGGYGRLTEAGRAETAAVKSSYGDFTLPTDIRLLDLENRSHALEDAPAAEVRLRTCHYDDTEFPTISAEMGSGRRIRLDHLARYDLFEKTDNPLDLLPPPPIRYGNLFIVEYSVQQRATAVYTVEGVPNVVAISSTPLHGIALTT